VICEKKMRADLAGFAEIKIRILGFQIPDHLRDLRDRKKKNAR